MGHSWIIDVLADLQSYAQKNDLPSLADELNKAAGVAAAEIATLTEGAPIVVRRDGERLQSILPKAGAS